MTDLSYDTRRLAGRTAVDRNYSKVGTIDDVYVDERPDSPNGWRSRRGCSGRSSTSRPSPVLMSYGDDVVVPL